jgi:hypothetical protein
VLEIQLADDLGPERSRLELDLYLSVFRSMHPNVGVDVTQPESSSAADTSSSTSGSSSVP